MIDRTFLQKTAELAYLSLTQDEIDSLRDDLTGILSFIHDLEEVSTEDMAPLITPFSDTATLREDVIEHTSSPQDILRNAPQTSEDFFLIPRFLC